MCPLVGKTTTDGCSNDCLSLAIRPLCECNFLCMQSYKGCASPASEEAHMPSVRLSSDVELSVLILWVCCRKKAIVKQVRCYCCLSRQGCHLIMFAIAVYD